MASTFGSTDPLSGTHTIVVLGNLYNIWEFFLSDLWLSFKWKLSEERKRIEIYLTTFCVHITLEIAQICWFLLRRILKEDPSDLDGYQVLSVSDLEHFIHPRRWKKIISIFFHFYLYFYDLDLNVKMREVANLGFSPKITNILPVPQNYIFIRTEPGHSIALPFWILLKLLDLSKLLHGFLKYIHAWISLVSWICQNWQMDLSKIDS